MALHHIIMGTAPYLLALALLVGVVELLRRHGLRHALAISGLPAVAVAFGGVALALRSARFLPYAALGILGLAVLWRASRGASPATAAPSRRRALVVGLFGLLLIAGAAAYRVSFFGSPRQAWSVWTTRDLAPGVFPVGAADWMEAHGASGGVFNLSAFHGSYLIWRLWPRIRVTFDGRGNLSPTEARDLAILRDHRHDPKFRDLSLRIILEASQRYYLTPPPAFPGAPPTHWHLRYADATAELWERDR